MNRTRRPRRRGVELPFVAGVLAPVFLFGVLAWAVAGEHTLAWERNIVDELVTYDEGGPFARAMAVLAAIGGDHSKAVPFVLIAMVVSGLVARGRIRGAMFVAASVVGAVLLIPILKAWFERPPIGSDPSLAYFPSGHATGSAVVVGSLIVLSWRTRWRWLVLIGGAAFALAYGLSLVVRASHYPLDVVAGWCVALALVSVMAFVVAPRKDA